ncbi:hypothetical protein ACMFMF_004555 [Clarireedia jacksonii]
MHKNSVRRLLDTIFRVVIDIIDSAFTARTGISLKYAHLFLIIVGVNPKSSKSTGNDHSHTFHIKLSMVSKLKKINQRKSSQGPSSNKIMHPSFFPCTQFQSVKSSTHLQLSPLGR